MRYGLTMIGVMMALALTSVVEATTQLPKKGGRVSLDFQDVEIRDVINAISEITGKNFIIDSGVSGKITIVSPQPVTIEDAYDAFLLALREKRLEAVDEGKFTVIQRGSTSIPGQIQAFDDYSPTAAQITRIVKLEHIPADTVREVIRRKVGRYGTVASYGPTNSLIITDSASNVQRLEQLIATLDKEGYKPTTEIIPLRYAQADDVAKKIETIIATTTPKRPSSAPGVVAAGEDISKIIPDNRTNSLMVVATRKGLEEVLSLLQELDRPVSDASKMGRVHIRRLKNANADDLAALLSSLFSGSPQQAGRTRSGASSTPPGPNTTSPVGATPATAPQAPLTVAVSEAGSGVFESEVRVAADISTNSLVITATPNDYQSILPIIDQLDTRRAQVFVEALIMEVKLDNTLNVGIGLTGTGGTGSAGLVGGTKLGNTGNPLLGPISPKTLGALAGLSGLALGGVMGTFNFPGTDIQLPISGAVFNAAQKKGYLNVLSAPKILTMDNKKAEISVGDKVPVSTGQTFIPGTTTPSFNVSREDVLLKLAVTPQINDGDAVTLEIEQKIQELGLENTDLKSFSTSERSATTTVVAQNRQTIALGGLIKDKQNKQTSKVPLLGDIPLIGYLFRDTKNESEKVNLLLYLTPHVIREPSDLTRISVKQNNERKAFNKKHNIGENQALYDYSLDQGLDMAPRPDRVTEPERRVRYDYENFQPGQDVGTRSVDEGIARRRETRSSSNITRAASISNRSAAATTGAANPFADIQPPSSSN